MNPTISPLTLPAPSTWPFEIVEHKGLGHPDSICDAVAETVSQRLCTFYVQRFGSILHHNVDKALLCGGASRLAFGGGELIDPIEIYVAGRATREYRGITVPVDELAIEATRAWLSANLRYLDVARDVRIQPKIRATSSDLQALFGRSGAGTPLANDTSFGAGFAPFDALETAVRAAARALNEPNFRRGLPWVGEDIKVMGARAGDANALTVACALVARHVASRADYDEKKATLAAIVERAAREASGLKLQVAVNAADGPSPDSVYLTVTGLSAEAGDDGQVGRGNRVNGLITPYRPMSLEAAAGKNPVTHVGKLYNVLANRIADAVAREVSAVEEAYCYLLSRIGAPVDAPSVFDVRVRLIDPTAEHFAALAPQITEVARAEFATIGSLWREAVAGTLSVC